MIESFVDLTYRGLALGRRIKLTLVRPASGYLELPMPMPVGTVIGIGTDEGILLEATVTQIHEQVGGSERVPGMTVRPQLGSEAAIGWWQARVALPEESEAPRERNRPVTVRPRTHTVPAPTVTVPPIPAGATPLTTEVTSTKELSVFVADQPPPQDDVKRTVVMNAVDQELLQKLTRSDGEVEQLVRRTGEHEVVDDGLRTTVMDAIDPSALGIEVSASGSFRAQTDSGESDDDDDGDDKPSSSSTPAKPKKRKKRR